MTSAAVDTGRQIKVWIRYPDVSLHVYKKGLLLLKEFLFSNILCSSTLRYESFAVTAKVDKSKRISLPTFFFLDIFYLKEFCLFVGVKKNLRVFSELLLNLKLFFSFLFVSFRILVSLTLTLHRMSIISGKWKIIFFYAHTVALWENWKMVATRLR